MVLVDTSVWVEHLRAGGVGLEALLETGEVLCHPFVVGELACGNLKSRAEILSLLNELPMALAADHDEVLLLLERHRLMGQGLGLIDIHLLASAALSGAALWTVDRRLAEAAGRLGVRHPR